MAFMLDIVERAMVACGRHCCICRRFAPLHLQVHHIEELADGGSDDEDNALPICLTCHSDVHTDTKLTRRFSVDEIKMARDLTYHLVQEGKLRAPEHPRALEEIIASATKEYPVAAPELPSILPEAVQILITAAADDGNVFSGEYTSGLSVQAGQTEFVTGAFGRVAALYLHAISQLENIGFIERTGKSLCHVTHIGYLAADQYMATAKSKNDSDSA